MSVLPKPVVTFALSLVAGVFILLGSVVMSMFALGFSGMMMGDGPGMMLPLMLKKLELTADQDAQVQNIMAAHRDTFKNLFTQLEAAHEEMASKFFAPGPLSAADLTSQTQGVSQLREQLMNEGLKVALEIRGVLTPDQLAKAAQLKDQMQALHAQMRSFFEEK